MTDRTILITGAGSGIGRGTAELFLAEGWRVAMLGRREAALAETAGNRPNALILPCDVTDEEAVDTAFDRLAATWGRLDVLFNNAGTTAAAAPIDEIPVEEWRRVCDVNITGMFIAARAAFRQMRRQSPQGGRIINTGSISAHAPRTGSTPYTVSKHAVTGLTRALSLDGRPFDIACGQIDIGNVLTEITRQMAARDVLQPDGTTAPEPMMDVSDVARSVRHMATLPLEANVQFMTVMATKMPYIGRG
ncbi:SDR family oxidoreductase [Roseitranquillus sediminis]|uniref:SDR family oxidoreductase n=1 Tax=Roseitranquillus sediminis TaxID=2809051 RepID=UPI001D0C877F|nr:SDR family oxidoreductase [Roseitranquillus sediminis]MBM9594063.1 SDR family oxidoreductase [Roseitranquillus sediminis]